MDEPRFITNFDDTAGGADIEPEPFRWSDVFDPSDLPIKKAPVLESVPHDILADPDE